MTTEPTTRTAGRPRDAAADEAILSAARALLAEGGVRAVTMSAVVRRSGVARATVYRRWSSNRSLITAAIRESMGFPPLEPTGDLETDLRAAAHQVQRVLANPALRPVLPAVVEALVAPDGDDAGLRFDDFAPGRARFIAAHVDAIGDDAASLADMVFGYAVARLLNERRPMTPDEADAVADLVIAGYRARGRGPAGPGVSG